MQNKIFLHNEAVSGCLSVPFRKGGSSGQVGRKTEGTKKERKH